MQYNNDAKQLKYEVLTTVAKLSFEGKLGEHVNQIPYDIIPGPHPSFRCCIYHEREIIRERISAARGMNTHEKQDGAILEVLPAACEGCPINRFTVTDNCQHCLAKKCQAACAFGAISITENGAHIDPSKCKECGRCAASCPYNAISDTLRPCLRSCPVDAITIDENHQAAINYSRCISCGNCTKNCPFGAITDISSIVDVIEAIKSGKQVFATFAPAIEGHFGEANVGMLKAALKKLGFADAVEVSLGADAVAQHEAHEFKEALQEGRKMTTSCCPAFVEMIEKHFPKLVPLMSNTVSPMTAVARYIKANNPNSVVVFIGPCIAKKLEIQKVEDTADFVLTFEELAALFNAKKINPADTAQNEQDGSLMGKEFAISGGVSSAVAAALNEEGFDMPFTCNKCNGAKECKKSLMILNAGRLPENLIEGMACEGGCVAGPAGIADMQHVKRNRAKLMAMADKRGIKENLEQIHDFSKIKMD